jgi:hypothetical protein
MNRRVEHYPAASPSRGPSEGGAARHVTPASLSFVYSNAAEVLDILAKLFMVILHELSDEAER